MKRGPVADAPIDGRRLDLLHIAFRAASAFPTTPHGKNRARAQEKVAMACFDLDQPKQALQFGKAIGDWRRGAVFADYACYCVLHGDLSEVDHWLELAQQVARDVENDPNQQEWRRDTILMKVSRAYALMGKVAEAAKVAGSIDAASSLAYDAGWAGTSASRAALITPQNLAAELDALEDVLLKEGSGPAWSALVTCGRLYEKFYAQPELRAQVEKRIDLTQQSKLPPDLRLATMIHVAKVALDHGDQAKGLELWREAKDFADGMEWSSDTLVSFVPQLAALRFRAGEREQALADIEAGLEEYHRQRDNFRVTKRAEILRPFAEALHTIGQHERAGEIWALVVEEGMQNPNSRPRAEDVSESCISMAKTGFNPDPKLLARIHEIVGGLGDPW